MSVHNKIKLFCEKPQKESITHRFKEGNYWEYLEKKSKYHNPVFNEGRVYFDSVCFKYKDNPSSFVLAKIKKHSRHKYDSVFKRMINERISSLLKNDLDDFLIDEKGFLRYTGPDKSKLPSSKIKRVDDGIKNWRYNYENNKIIDRENGEYFFIDYYTTSFYSEYRKRQVTYTNVTKTKLTIKQLKFYGFYKEPEY